MNYTHTPIEDLVHGRSYIPLKDGKFQPSAAGTFIEHYPARPIKKVALRWQGKPRISEEPVSFILAKHTDTGWEPIQAGGKKTRKAMRKKRRTLRR